MCAAALQGGRADQGRVGLPGPLRGQIPGPSREAGTQADGALRPGRGSDEEGSCGERIETLMMGAKWSIVGGLQGYGGGVGMSGFTKMTDLCFNEWVGFVGEMGRGEKKSNKCC